MTIYELYNTLEEAIGSGKVTLNSDIYFIKGVSHNLLDIAPINYSKVDSEGDLFLASDNKLLIWNKKRVIE